MDNVHSARPAMTKMLGVLLLVTLFALSGCGASGNATPTPEPTIPPTSTLVPTMEPLPTVSVKETPIVPVVATSDPTEEAEVTEEEATVEATVEASEDVTATEETVEQATSEPEVEATEAVTTTETVTDTEVVSDAETDTDTEDHSTHEGHTAVITSTNEFTTTGTITDSEGSETPSTGFEAASDASVFFLQPTTNAVVPLTVTVVMSYTGVTLAPVADAVQNAGHFHVLIDTDFIEAGQPIPTDANHLHFGNGATKAEIGLAPGSHTLRLQFADNNHIALDGEQFRHEIIVSAVEGAPAQSVRIASPSAGATVPTTLTVVMAATGLTVEPAGMVSKNAGHLHLLINEPFVRAGAIIPANETHIHFGKGQLSAELTLEPGIYTLRLQFADGEHRALNGKQYQAEVQIIVAEDAPAEQVMFVKPANGATVTSPFLVAWAASGLIIEPAGAVTRPEAGHLHILVDEPFVPGGEVIPADETHIHFGKGQTTTQLTLEPGKHTLRLQMADGAHIAQDGKQYQDTITVTVR